MRRSDRGRGRGRAGRCWRMCWRGGSGGGGGGVVGGGGEVVGGGVGAGERGAGGNRQRMAAGGRGILARLSRYRSRNAPQLSREARSADAPATRSGAAAQAQCEPAVRDRRGDIGDVGGSV